MDDLAGPLGSTRARVPGEPSSPHGPSQHDQWTDPLAFHEDADDAALVARAALAMAVQPAPAAPVLSARAAQGRAVVRWRLPEGAPEGTRLVLSLDAPADDEPPATYHARAARDRQPPAATGARARPRLRRAGTRGRRGRDGERRRGRAG